MKEQIVKELAEDVYEMNWASASDIEYDDGVAYSDGIDLHDEAYGYIEIKVGDENYDEAIDAVEEYLLDNYSRELAEKYEKEVEEANELQDYYDANR